MIAIYLMIGMIFAGVLFKWILEDPDCVTVEMEMILRYKILTVACFALYTVIWPYILFKGIKEAIDEQHNK